MISSRVQIASLSVAVLLFTRSCALFNHTSVPCESPEIRISSSKVLGFVSTSISRTNLVPNSGTPNVPTFEPISSGFTPSASVELNILIVSLSSSLIFVGFIPVIS